MLSFLKNVKESLTSLSAITNGDQYEIVFYAEGASDYLFIGSLFEALLAKTDYRILYITSSSSDQILNREHNNLKVIYIKDGGILGYVFQNLKARLFITTLTDLGYFHFKRSPDVEDYVYLFHSLNSAHMVYRREAFKNYDHILSPAQHITDELRAMEAFYNWPVKQIANIGYARLDALRAEKVNYPDLKEKQVLIAPSWGEHGLIETGKAQQLASILLGKGYAVVVQPHPMTLRKSPKRVDELAKMTKSCERVSLNTDITNKAPFFESAFLITDWSGASYEYAFTHDRPVIYVNTSTPKCRNDDFKDIDLAPKEITIREHIGEVIDADNIDMLPSILTELDHKKDIYKTQIRDERQDMLFNIDESTDHGLTYILELISLEK